MMISVNRIGANKKNNLLVKKTIEMQRQYESINNYFDKIARIVFEGYLNNSQIAYVFEERERKALYKF